ncbi:MAG: MATE family efflux transporter [Oscillospiraceae bacterium]|nr:MATE family efflux transporter [Oscillospiraceae bacterium]
MRKRLSAYIPDKKFFRLVLSIALPMMIQNTFTNLISLVNNVTVGRLGTEQLAGVAVANQLVSIYIMCIWGTMSGAEIFGAQYHGNKDMDNLRNTFRFMILMALLVSAVSAAIFLVFGEPLVKLYIFSDAEGSDVDLALREGTRYLRLLVISFLPLGLNMGYTSILRVNDQNLVPMYSSMVGIVSSLAINFLLIPRLGIDGAAVATISSRVLESLINIVWCHTHPDRLPFLKGVFKTLKVPKKLAKQILLTGLPLTANETIWQIGVATITQCYSYRGLSSVAAVNIATTVQMLTSVSIFALGAAIGVVMGNLLGAGDKDGAEAASKKLMGFSVFVGLSVGLLLLVLGPLVPVLYPNLSPEVHEIAKWLVWGEAFDAVLNSFYNAAYYIIRSGGKTVTTFLFDSGFIWGVSVVVAVILAYFTSVSIIPFYWIEKVLDILKCIIIYLLVRKGSWIQVLSKENDGILMTL